MADDLSVTREGDTLVIRIPIKTPTPSASGKTLVVASTRGNQKTGVQINGKDLYVGVNAIRLRRAEGRIVIEPRCRDGYRRSAWRRARGVKLSLKRRAHRVSSVLARNCDDAGHRYEDS